MKAKCIRELTIDGYRFEPGKEYDIEWRAFTRDADNDDPVLARGHKVRHIQYAVKYDMLVPLPFNKLGTEKTPATLFLYDRQYCEHEDYTAPAIDPLGLTSGGPLFCFDDFFEEVHDRKGGVWHPEPEPSGLKPLKMSLMTKKELEELSKKVLGDKAEKPMVLCTDMPRLMSNDRWLREYTSFPNRPREIHIPEEKLNVVARFLNQHLHDLPPINPDELKGLGVIIKAEDSP